MLRSQSLFTGLSFAKRISNFSPARALQHHGQVSDYHCTLSGETGAPGTEETGSISGSPSIWGQGENLPWGCGVVEPGSGAVPPWDLGHTCCFQKLWNGRKKRTEWGWGETPMAQTTLSGNLMQLRIRSPPSQHLPLTPTFNHLFLFTPSLPFLSSAARGNWCEIKRQLCLQM